MHMNAQRPVFVPQEYWRELEQLSKAALMDLVWDYATRCAGSEVNGDIIAELRKSADIIATHRKNARAA